MAADAMRSFQHVTPPLRLFGGPDSLSHLGRELRRLGSSRAVLFCGASLAREGSLVGAVRNAMGERCAGVFAGVKAHSPVAAVEQAAAELARMEADAVVALGGGSAVVTARAASILMAETGSVRSLSTFRDERGQLQSPKLLAPKLPQLVVPTTPTTATVKAGSAVFDEAASERLALFDPKTRAQSVFLHPAAIGSAPAALLVSASLNTFCVSIEALMSRSGDPISDALLIHALRLLWTSLPAAAAGDPAARGELAMAAILCGQGTDYTGGGITTVLGHAVGARFGTENGTVNAILLPHALRFNGEAGRPGLAKVAAALGLSGPGAADGVAAMAASLFRDLAVPGRLRELGVTEAALPAIAEAGIADWFLGGNPRPVGDAAELSDILAAAW